MKRKTDWVRVMEQVRLEVWGRVVHPVLPERIFTKIAVIIGISIGKVIVEQVLLHCIDSVKENAKVILSSTDK